MASRKSQTQIDLETRVKELEEEEKSLMTPVEMGGFSVSTLPQPKYELRGGKYVDESVWEEAPFRDALENLAEQDPDMLSRYPEDRRVYSGGNIWGVREGYRVNAENLQEHEGAIKKVVDPMKRGGFEQYVSKKKYDPFRWELDDPAKDIREQLTTSENARVERLGLVQAELSQKGGKLKWYGKDDDTARASRPGTRGPSKGGFTILGGRPNLFTGGKQVLGG